MNTIDKDLERRLDAATPSPRFAPKKHLAALSDAELADILETADVNDDCTLLTFTFGAETPDMAIRCAADYLKAEDDRVRDGIRDMVDGFLTLDDDASGENTDEKELLRLMALELEQRRYNQDLVLEALRRNLIRLGFFAAPQ